MFGQPPQQGRAGAGQVEKAALPDGTEVYRISGGDKDAVVDVTASEPHRIVGTDLRWPGHAAARSWISCVSASGLCTVTANVYNTVQAADYHKVTAIKVSMRSVVNGGRLGTKVCSSDASMAPNSSTVMSCSVRFVVPRSRSPQWYPVESKPIVQGTASYEVDTEALYQKLESDFKDMMNELK